MGGAPLRVVRVTGAGATVLDRWLGGDLAVRGEGEAALARRLTDSGVAVPVVPARSLTPDDGVTIVIPVRDRPDGLAATLRALRPLLDALPSAEVLVVDDASSDTGALRLAVEGSGVAAGVIHRPRQGGPAAARNIGWRAGHGQTVAFLDADCLPEPRWLEALVPHLDDTTVAAVGPRVPAAPTAGRSSALGRYEAARSPLDLGRDAAPVRPGSKVAYLPSAALVVRRKALEEVGGFDEDLHVGEDVDLIWRLVGAGWRVHYDPTARVGHPPRPSLAAALRQRASYGASAADLEARHGPSVAPLALPWVNAAAWAAAAAVPPAAVAAAGAGALAWSARRLARRTGLPPGEAARLAWRGHLAGGRAFAEAARRTWWPAVAVLAVAAPRRAGRLAVLAGAPLLVEWPLAGRPVDPLRWLGLRVADDLAYGAGVWAGCVRARRAGALLPRLIR